MSNMVPQKVFKIEVGDLAFTLGSHKALTFDLWQVP